MLQGNDPWAVMESEVQSFRAGTVRFLEILMHFDHEKLYVEKGYSSLFALLTERYGFSEGAAVRRINCCRAAQTYPPCLNHLVDGSLSISTLSAISKLMTTENGEMLIKKVQGKSTDQVRAIVDALKSVAKQAEALPFFDAHHTAISEPSAQQPALEDNTAKIVAQSLAAVTPQTKHPLPTSEQIEALNPATVAEPAKVIRFTGENLHLYRKAEERFGHLHEEHLITRVFTVALRSLLPRTTQQRAYNTATRYIPARIREEVLERDGHQCAFVAEDGHRCSARSGLQLDHLVPFSQGGKSTLENLRAMCPAHNQLLAEQAFGKAFMERKREQGK
jgi:5-methylcytosine-specific restriction endonuclease McrA